jgi:preprotein translocase subunit SecY
VEGLEEEKPRSKLFALRPALKVLPEIEVPKRHVSFKERFLWTCLALLAFLAMTQIPLYGGKSTVDIFQNLRFVFASYRGTVVELGIGPIVTAGIILQLLVGSKIIGLDLSESEDRALFTSLQKGLAILMAVFEASMLVWGGWYDPRRVNPSAAPLSTSCMLFLVLQLTLGAVVVLYLDELVSKYGLGSGISLFILAGVAMEICWQSFSPFSQGGQYIGAVPNFVHASIKGTGVGDAFLRAGLPNMLGFLTSILLFLLVLYLNNISVGIPLAYERAGGIRGRYPISLLYTNVIPVILAMAVFANLRLLGSILPSLKGVSDLVTPPGNLQQVISEPLRAVIYLAIFLPLCVGFSWVWIYLAGMGPRDIAEQLRDAEMFIPGFRRDVRMMEEHLSRYLIGATLLSGVLVALLSAFGDFMGSIGSGTGILLAVGIAQNLHQEISRQRVAEMFPAVRRLLGE